MVGIGTSGFIQAIIAILVVFAVLLIGTLAHTVYTRFIANRKSSETGDVDTDVIHAGNEEPSSAESNPVSGGNTDEQPHEHRSYDTDELDELDGFD